jgi:hypothetical protein
MAMEHTFRNKSFFFRQHLERWPKKHRAPSAVGINAEALLYIPMKAF